MVVRTRPAALALGIVIAAGLAGCSLVIGPLDLPPDLASDMAGPADLRPSDLRPPLILIEQPDLAEAPDLPKDLPKDLVDSPKDLGPLDMSGAGVQNGSSLGDPPPPHLSDAGR